MSGLLVVRRYALAPLVIVLATVLLSPFRDSLTTLNIALTFLIAVAAVSLFNEVWPSTASAILAFLCFGYFFVRPYGTFQITARDHILALFVFLGMAVLLSQLVTRIRIRSMDAIRRGRQTETLYDLSIALISEVTRVDTLNAIVVRVREVFALDTCAILLQEEDEISALAVAGDPITFSNRNLLVLARWVMEHRQSAGMGSARTRVRRPHPAGVPEAIAHAGEDRRTYTLLLPIATSQRAIGVLLVRRDRGRGQFDAEQTHMLETFANQAAIAIERILLTEDQTNARILVRSDELKSALLSAVSHDLRTPLASIKASATSLLQPGISWSDEDRHELLTAIDEEVDRMNGLISNLLDLSRIEAGAMRLDLAWCEPNDLVQTAIEHTGTLLAGHTVEVDVPADLPVVQVDYVKVVRVLVNLLQNAAKYSPAESTITIVARATTAGLEVSVSDEGIGINPVHLDRIFDKFYRVEDPRRPLGAGVGLAICKGYVEAHNGRIWAEARVNGGSVLRFTLPLTESPAVDPPHSDVNARVIQ